VANYNIDFLVSIKNTNKLAAFNKQLDQTGKKVRETVQGLSEIGQISKVQISNIIGFGNALSKAQSNFNQAVRGAKEFKAASRELIRAEREYNAELQKRQAILESIRRGSNFAQFSRSASQISGPTVFDTATQKSIDRNRRNQNRRAGRSSVPFGPQQFIGPLPMQGPMFGPMQGPMPMMTVNNNPRILRNIAASQVARGGTGFRGFSESIRGGGFFPAKKLDAVTKSINRHAKKIEKSTARMATHLQSRGIVPDAAAYASPIGPQPARPSLGGFFNRMGFGNRANPQGPFANSRGRQGRLSGSISSGLIGGGFPLLFGQGPLAAAGGGIGGLAGGALGGGFGFGLSIAGTAIASRIQESIDFRKAIDKLNLSIKATGGTSLFTAKQVAEFAKSLGMTKDEALEALKAFKQFEASARITLNKTFGSEGVFDIFAKLNNNQSVLNVLPELSKELSLDQAQLALDVLKTNGARSAELKLLDMIFDKNKAIVKSEKEKVNLLDLLNPVRGGVKRRDDGQLRGLTIDELKTQRGKEAAENFQNQLNQAKDLLQIQKDFNKELERQAIIKAPVDELERLLDPLTQIDALGKSIGNSFSESFKGIIKGSMSAQDALRNLFQRTADHFLDMAAQILAAQIRIGIFGLFSNVLSPSPNRIPTPKLTSEQIQNRFALSESSRASGGPVKGGSSYLVGERGPELFSPGVSGMITPNHALGGSTNIVVNVDASGSSVEGDEEQGRELGRLISVAVQSEIIQQQRPGGLLA